MRRGWSSRREYGHRRVWHVSVAHCESITENMFDNVVCEGVLFYGGIESYESRVREWIEECTQQGIGIKKV